MVLHSTRDGASTAFRQCMEGRFGCGGSSFPRVRIVCDDSNDCGGCGLRLGCNLGGSTVFYCDSSNAPCDCIGVVLHETAHSWGALHTAEYFRVKRCVPGDPACEIGDWFVNECLSPGGRFPQTIPTDIGDDNE